MGEGILFEECQFFAAVMDLFTNRFFQLLFQRFAFGPVLFFQSVHIDGFLTGSAVGRQEFADLSYADDRCVGKKDAGQGMLLVELRIINDQVCDNVKQVLICHGTHSF